MDSLTDHWKWITGSLATALFGWIARRRPSGLWSWCIRIWKANTRVTALEQAVSDRDQTIAYLRSLLEVSLEAGELVSQARHQGLIHVSAPSANAPSPSPASSSPSPSKPVSIPSDR